MKTLAKYHVFNYCVIGEKHLKICPVSYRDFRETGPRSLCFFFVDCSQPPYFSVGFSRPVRFGISERDLGRVSKLPRGAGVGVSIVGAGKPPNSAPLPSVV